MMRFPGCLLSAWSLELPIQLSDVMKQVMELLDRVRPSGCRSECSFAGAPGGLAGHPGRDQKRRSEPQGNRIRLINPPIVL